MVKGSNSRQSTFTAWLEAALSLVFPSHCRLCGRLDDALLCRACVGSFTLLDTFRCSRCGKPTAMPAETCRECRGRCLAFETATAAGIYSGGLREAIRELKFRNGKRMAYRLADFAVATCGIEPGCFDLLTFVPMPKRREQGRGYNQAFLLAREIGGLIGMEPESLLIRTGRSIPQRGLSLEERRRNLRGSIRPASPAKGRVLLVDDVYTTGSTADECARVLKEAGAQEVTVLTIARTVKE
ncbi:MAG: double zinc ribbon domain-containing protein [Candidatus Aquicultorales bacterium]